MNGPIGKGLPIALMISPIFSILFPLLAMILMGYGYARLRSIDINAINQLNMEVLTPALLFSVLSERAFHLSSYQELALGGTGIILGSGILLWPIVQILGLDKKTFLLPMMFTNTANLGIPVQIFALGEKALQGAVVLFIVETLLHLTLGLYVISHHPSWRRMFTSPMVLSTLAGLIINLGHISIPSIVLVPLKMLGNCVIPLMLFSLGVRLTELDFKHWQIGFLGGILCPASGILTFLLIRSKLSLTPLHADMLFIFSALPPAILNYMIAEQYHQEPHKVAAIVFMGNMMSFISLPLVLFFIL